MRVAGIDEVGRGPLAGPVVAAAVVFPEGYSNSSIRDSKKLSAQKRESLVLTIKQDALSWAIVAVGHQRITAINIREATRLAMRLALARVQADSALIDGNTPIDCAIPQETVIGGDDKFVQIAAASIIAKVYRDALMCTLDKRYPGYGFDRHAGYGTSFHRAAIETLGPCPIHRRGFAGVREFCLHSSASLQKKLKQSKVHAAEIGEAG